MDEVTSRKRKPRGFRIALGVLASLFILFVLALLLLPRFLPVGTIRSIARDKAAELAGVDVDFQGLRFAWNGDVVLDGVTVSPLTPDGGAGPTLLTVDTVRTNVALLSLLSGNVVVESVDVNGFSLRVERDEEGNLNLPDFSPQDLAAAPRRPPSRRGIPLSAARAAEAASLPPIEVRRVRLTKGVISLEDAASGFAHDIGVDHLDIQGGSLDAPFAFSGKVYPYAEEHGYGAMPFRGRAALLKNMAFDPDGEASLELTVDNFLFHPLAAAAGLGDLLQSGRVGGTLRLGYGERKGALELDGFAIQDAVVGLGEGLDLSVPDTGAALDLGFDSVSGVAILHKMSLDNELVSLDARGEVTRIYDILDGGLPESAIFLSGTADLSRASGYIAALALDRGPLPTVEGAAAFTGRISLPSSLPLSPDILIQFSDGSLHVEEPDTGIVAGMDLPGLELRAMGRLEDDGLALTSAITLTGTTARAIVPQLTEEPILATLNGGIALIASPVSLEGELRLEETLVQVPATAWSTAMAVRIPETRITANIPDDRIRIEATRATINDAIEAAISAGTLNGLLAGRPEGRLAIDTSAVLAAVEQIIQPLLPENMIRSVNGTLRASTSLAVEGNTLEARVVAEAENAAAAVTLDGGMLQASASSPAARLSLLATLDVERFDGVRLQSLEAGSEGSTVEAQDLTKGLTVAGQTGAMALRAAGNVDLAAMTAEFSSLAGEMAGIALALANREGQRADLSSGILSAIIASADNHALFPVDGEGAFAVPQFDLGIDTVRFTANGETAALGNLRLAAAADGYLGSERQQIVTLRKAEFAAAPMAVNSRGQADLGTGAFLLEYAARLAPAGLSPVLRFLGLPPALLADLAVSGAVSQSDNQINSKGSVQGILQISEGVTSPFGMDHDLSAAWNTEDRSLAIDVRRLDGSVKTASGEAAVTMAAQQSRLLLKRGASKGLLDIRFKGTAGPTRMLALGLVGVVPQLSDYSQLLHSSQAEGVYDAWIQIRDKEAATLALSVGGFWQGAALAVNGVPFLAERGKLTAGLEGEIAFADNQARITRMLLRSDSAAMQADGQAVLALLPGASFIPDGIASVDANLRFIMADLSQAARVFPGLVPADLGLEGRMDGTLRASGDVANITISDAGMNFQNFRAVPSPALTLAIPSGAARFGAALSYTPEMATGSLWDPLKTLSLRNGQASLTGASLNGNAIDDMSASFHLEEGRFALNSARIMIGGGSAGSLEAEARIDFNFPLPRVDARWALHNMPIPFGASPDSVTMQGALSIQDGQASVPAFTLQTVSGLIQANGAGSALFTVDGDGMPTGLTTVQAAGRFSVADLARLGTLLTGVLPADFRMAGAVEGSFSAAGDAQDIRITDSAVHFRGFAVTPSPDVTVSIPSGTASLSGNLSLNLEAPRTGSPFDAARLVNVRDGRAALGTVTALDKTLTDITASFALQDGILTLHSAQFGLGGTGGSIAAGAVADLTRPTPSVTARVTVRDIPLSEFNPEISDYLSIQSGTLTIPAQGDAVGVAFMGLSVDEILQTLRLDNFSFATSPVLLHTGPVLNTELDRAKALLKMSSTGDGAREISFTTITGTAQASGNGVISIPNDAPIELVGRDTADFRARGEIFANHTLDMKVMVTGKMENLISFSLPNLIPTLNNDRESSNRLINQMNASAAKGDYGVHVKGSLAAPDISGIYALAGQVLKDILKSSGLGIIGGALDLGKDAPGAILNLGGSVLEGVLNPAETVRNAPENIIKSPERALRGLGQAFGIGGSRNREEEEGGEESDNQPQERERNRLQLPFGIH